MDEKSIQTAGVIGASTETVQRFGEAVKVHLVAYTGQDNETGQKLAKGLKEISQSKTNPQHHTQNVKQQAGFSAEVKAVARENAERAIRGEKNTRTTRTDDMAKQSDGKGGTIGGKNEQYYDLAEVDKNGIYVEGSGRQLKFVGGTPEECADRLLLKKYDKYRDADIDIEIPSDFHDKVVKTLTEKAERLQKEIDKAEKNGNAKLAEQKKAQLDRVEKTRQNLKKSNVSNKDALEARLHAKLSTAKDIARVSNRAGIQAAQSGAIVGGGISFIRNSVAVIKGEKELTEAVGEVAGDTATAAGLGYATGFAGSVVKGYMQNASSNYLQALSKTNLPATLVATAWQTGKTLKKYANNEIDGVECLTELGENGVGMLASAAGAAIGQVVIPIPVVGSVVGGMVGYAMSTAYYNSLVTTLKEAKLAHEDRLLIEKECEEAVACMRQYRNDIESATQNYLSDHIQAFQQAITIMKTASDCGSVDDFVVGANIITEKLGGTPQFRTKTEFDSLMNKPESFKL